MTTTSRHSLPRSLDDLIEDVRETDGPRSTRMRPERGARSANRRQAISASGRD